jgi:hypothetical protein
VSTGLRQLGELMVPNDDLEVLVRVFSRNMPPLHAMDMFDMFVEQTSGKKLPSKDDFGLGLVNSNL